MLEFCGDDEETDIFKKWTFETRMGSLSKNIFGVTVHVDDVLHLIAFPTNFDRADAAWMVLRAWRKEALNPGVLNFVGSDGNFIASMYDIFTYMY